MKPSPEAPWLIVVAAPAEAKAVLGGLGVETDPPAEWQPRDVDASLALVMTGVGKANAAAGVGIALHSRTYGAVINVGIAGALPTASSIAIGDSVASTRSVYADEGLALPDGSFVGCSEMGFPLGPFDDRGVLASPDLLDSLASLVSATGPVATVSTCSGTDALARTFVERTQAVAEAMEGAAVGQVAARLGVPFIEIRAISNTTGNRESQIWSIGKALSALSPIAVGIATLARTR